MMTMAIGTKFNVATLGILLTLAAYTMAPEPERTALEPKESKTLSGSKARMKPRHRLYGQVSLSDSPRGLALENAGSISRGLGLKSGDLLLSYNDQSLTVAKDFDLDFFKSCWEAKTIVSLIRDGQTMSIVISPDLMREAYEKGGGPTKNCSFLQDQLQLKAPSERAD
jgi:hypothetical protein